MVIFKSYVNVYQRVIQIGGLGLQPVRIEFTAFLNPIETEINERDGFFIHERAAEIKETRAGEGTRWCPIVS